MGKGRLCGLLTGTPSLTSDLGESTGRDGQGVGGRSGGRRRRRRKRSHCSRRRGRRRSRRRKCGYVERKGR